MRVADAIDSAIWAIEEDWLRRLRAIALGEGESPEAVAAKLGRPLQNTQLVTIRDNGVAILPIVGPIFRYANLFTEVSGATSVDILARDLQAALDNPAVKAIVLDVNSPGGQVDGINETANMIAASDKPIVAYVSGTAASGAYWLASAADRVILDATGRVGSIGVVISVDTTADPNVLEIVSSQSPDKRPDVKTPEGRSAIQAQVDAIATVFVDAVAKNRSVSREAVLTDFGRGSVKVGSNAIASRMADDIGSLERTISLLAAEQMPRRRRKGTMAEGTPSVVEAGISAEVHKAAIDKSLAEGMDLGEKQGKAEGMKAERERILGIQNIALPGHDDLVVSALSSGMSVADFAMEQAKAEKATRAKQLEAIKSDGKVEAVTATASSTGEVKPAAAAADAPLDEQAKAEWDANPALRAEFDKTGKFEGYLAYRRAVASGKVSVFRREDKAAS